MSKENVQHKWQDRKNEIVYSGGIDKQVTITYLEGIVLGFPASLFFTEVVKSAFKIETSLFLAPMYVGFWAVCAFLPGKTYNMWAKYVFKKAEQEEKNNQTLQNSEKSLIK